MGKIKVKEGLSDKDVLNVDVGRRTTVVYPPEPPAKYLMADPKNSIYIGRTEVFNAPFHWTYARLTNPHLVISGITGSGKSISPLENVLVKSNGRQVSVRIGSLIDSLINEKGSEIIEDCEGVSDPGIEVWTFDKNLKGKWSKVRFAGRKSSPEILYEFTTRSGRSITTTGDHNMVVIKDSEVRVTKSTEVAAGNFVPIPRNIKSSGSIKELNLLELLKDRNVYIYGVAELLKENFELIEKKMPIDPRYDNYLRFYKKGRAIPIAYFLKLLEFIKVSDENLSELKIRTRNKIGSLPALIPLTKEFMRFLGYFISEGMSKDNYVHISCLEKRVEKDILASCSIFNIRAVSKKGVKIHSRVLVELLDALGIKTGSARKRAPQILHCVDDILLAEYFKAYYEGDGCCEKNYITAMTKSKELANDHLYLLLRFGIIGRMQKKFKRATNTEHKGNWYYQISISGGENIQNFAKIGFVTPEKNRKLFELLQRKKDTNIDTIPEIANVVKKIYKTIKFDRSQMSYSIATVRRKPSREYLGELSAVMRKRLDEIKVLRREVEQLRRMPTLQSLIEIAEEKKLGPILYKELDESWRRAKKGLVKTGPMNVNKIAEITGKKINLEELRSAFTKVFNVIDVGIEQHDCVLYDFCSGRSDNVIYERLEKAAEFTVAEYDKLYHKVCDVEKDVEFIELLADSDLFWDEIVEVRKVKSKHPYVYDLCVDDEVFLAGYGGMFVHNSYLIKTFLVRAALVWNANAIIIDWAGEYKSWVKQVGGKVVALAKGAYLNLLDLAGMKPATRTKQVVRSLEILTDIGQYPEQRRLIEEAINEAYTRAGFKLTEKDQKDALGNPLKAPTLKDVQKVLVEKLETGAYEFPAELENAIYKIKQFTLPGDDYFAEQSTIDLDKLVVSGIVSIDLSGLPSETFRALGALTILQFIKEKMRVEGWTPEKGIKLFVVLDEAWKIAKEDTSDAVTIVREGRKYQFALIVASQNPTDISEIIFSNAGTSILLRLKFEKFLDYVQGTLRFSDYIRSKIMGFGVGQCAVNMAYEKPIPFAETFVVRKIDGEEPIIDYFLDIYSILTEEQRRDVTMAKTFSMERMTFKKRLREFGLRDEMVEEVSTIIEKGARHIDAVEFVIELERRGVSRKSITSFMRELGIDDPTIINIFTRADQKRTGLTDKEISQVVLE